MVGLMQNVFNFYTLSLVIMTVFAIAMYLMHTFRRKQLMGLLPLIAAIITAFLLYNVIGTQGAGYYNLLLIDICIAAISSVIAVLYVSKSYVFIPLMLLLIAGFILYVADYPGNFAFAGMFAVGTIYGILYREFVIGSRRERRRRSITEKRTELNRDYIQILLGIVLVAVLLAFSTIDARSIIFALIIIGYTAINLVANLRLSPSHRKTLDLERRDVEYGRGAAYLAASTALVVGFTSSYGMLFFGLVALFFADSLATIFGLSAHGAAPLPYNRNKTFTGTLTFLIVAAIAGYMLIGPYGLLYALILAFVEGLSLSLDDNVRTGILVVLLGSLVKV